jgi:hypothetical protein
MIFAMVALLAFAFLGDVTTKLNNPIHLYSSIEVKENNTTDIVMNDILVNFPFDLLTK